MGDDPDLAGAADGRLPRRSPGRMMNRRVFDDRAPTAVFTAFGAIVVVWIGATNLVTFFGRQMNDPVVWGAFSTRETIPVRAALDPHQAYEAILGSPTIAP